MEHSNTTEDYYTTTEAAKELGIDDESVRAAARRGALGFSWARDRFGGKFRAFFPGDVQAYKARREARMLKAAAKTVQGGEAA